ncbi:MAG: hypothetical protein DRP58_08510 [Spirochaetes bacterium]|nr:MAG: hypothetical protein DRP58_08510 [Spirochaetota bacterium]
MEITTNPRGKFSIQIKYVLTVSISDYYYMVLREEWGFPSFSSECPICGGSNCCVRIGYYYRYVLSLEEEILLLIPIARYLCKRKNKPKIEDKTFSLLPDCLIPYMQPTIDTLMQVIGNKLIKKKTNEEIVSLFYYQIYEVKLNISSSTLRNYYELFEQTAQKIKTFLREREKDDYPEQVLHSLIDVYWYLSEFQDPQYGKGPGSCSLWYHESLGGYRNNAYFLFGTPSQFRY